MERIFSTLKKSLFSHCVGLGFEVAQGIGHHGHGLGSGADHDVAAIGTAFVFTHLAHRRRAAFGLAHVGLAQQQRLDHLAVLVAQFDQHGGVGRRPRRQQLVAAQLRGADFFGLGRLEVRGFEQEAADLGEVGRVIIALLHPPQIVLLHEVQLIRAAFDDDGGDVIDRQVAQELQRGALPAAALPRGLVALVEQPGRRCPTPPPTPVE